MVFMFSKKKVMAFCCVRFGVNGNTGDLLRMNLFQLKVED